MSRPRLRLAELLDRGARGPRAQLVEYLRRHEPPRPAGLPESLGFGRTEGIRAVLLPGLPALVVCAVGMLLFWRGTVWLGLALGALAGLTSGLFAWWFGFRIPRARLRLLREGRLHLGTVVARTPSGQLEGVESLLVVFREAPGEYRQLHLQGSSAAFAGLDRGSHVVVLVLDDPWPAGVLSRKWDLLLGRLGGHVSRPEATEP